MDRAAIILVSTAAALTLCVIARVAAQALFGA